MEPVLMRRTSQFDWFWLMRIRGKKARKAAIIIAESDRIVKTPEL